MPTASALPTVPSVTPEQVLAARGVRVVDLRTPAEFAVDHLPGAVNLPLFEDVQRQIVGTLYKRVSREAAFEQGRLFARGRIGELVAAIGRVAEWEVPPAQLEERLDELAARGIERLEGELALRPARELAPGALVLHCWRGGLRSRSVVAFLRALGLGRAVGLAGGYRAYRQAVCAELESLPGAPTFVLRGGTGVGKSLVLRALAARRPAWTLDLEAAAEHRGSLLGMVGLAPVSQKRFESQLALRLRERRAAGAERGPLVLEGESRKVGDVGVPAKLWQALDQGVNIQLEAPLERRVQVLADDYLADPADRAQLAQQLARVEELMGRRKYAGVLTRMLAEERIFELVALLLEHYYDPRYRHGERARATALALDASDPQAAAEEIEAWIEAWVARAGARGASA